MAAVRGRIEKNILGPAFDAAFEYRFQGFEGCIMFVKRQIVTEDQAAPTALAEDLKQSR